jgi:hypothetical protein
MITDEQKENPVCTFFKEDYSAYEENITLVDEIENEIRKRTEKICGNINFKN